MSSVHVGYRLNKKDAGGNALVQGMAQAIGQAEDRLIGEFGPIHYHLDSVSETTEFYHVSYRAVLPAQYMGADIQGQEFPHG